jgi:hypothetical protein
MNGSSQEALTNTPPATLHNRQHLSEKAWRRTLDPARTAVSRRTQLASAIMTTIILQ